MSIPQMRQAIAQRYPGQKWADRVKTMSDAQVYATYNRLLNSKQL